MMFRQIRNLKDITSELAAPYEDLVTRAGPVMGVLWLDFFMYEMPSPPALSPVGTYLVEMTFGLWDDPAKHLRTLRKEGVQILGEHMYDAWSKRILELCSDPYRLVALTVPLLIEGQMKVIAASPYPAQEVLLQLLSPIIEATAAPLRHEDTDQLAAHRPNARIAAVLHAGKVPFVLTCR